MIETTNSCLFVNKQGELLQVFCSFRVIALHDVFKIRQGEVVFVSEVKSSEHGNIVFVINEENYYHHHFSVLI